MSVCLFLLLVSFFLRDFLPRTFPLPQIIRGQKTTRRMSSPIRPKSAELRGDQSQLVYLCLFPDSTAACTLQTLMWRPSCSASRIPHNSTLAREGGNCMNVSRLLLASAVFAIALTTSGGKGTPVAYAAPCPECFKITICHATGNAFHWNEITVSFNAAVGVPTDSEILGELANSGHFDASGN